MLSIAPLVLVTALAAAQDAPPTVETPPAAAPAAPDAASTAPPDAAPPVAAAPPESPRTTTAPALPPVSPSKDGKARKRLLVLDFRNDGVEQRTVLMIRDALTTHLSKASDSVDVLSTEDMRRVLDVESAKAALGCDMEACMAEIANALGADLILFGNVGTLGGLIVGDMSLLDPKAGTSLGRESIEVQSLDKLPSTVREAGTRLAAGAGVIIAGEPAGPSPMFIAGVGAALVGAVGAVVGGVLAGGAYGTITDLVSNDSAKDDAEAGFPVYMSVAVVGAGVAAAGAGIMAYASLE